MFCYGQSGGTNFRGDQLMYDRPNQSIGRETRWFARRLSRKTCQCKKLNIESPTSVRLT